MPSSSSRPASHKSSATSTPNTSIDKLDYHPGGRPLLRPDSPSGDNESPTRPSHDTSHAGSFFEHVASGVVDKDRDLMKQQVTRYLSFSWAIVNCLCAGSITAYSLYAPLFQKELHYSQLQVNGVSITAELSMYLPVPIFGLLCDRYGPGPPSLLAGVLFGIGYVLAAFTFKSGPPISAGGTGWPYPVMIASFIPIGMATSCMYLSAVTTCAKNFGRGKYKGIALALPIAAFGLSGMWQSQIGNNLLYTPLPDGSKGPVDVHRFFFFLGILLLTVGVIGTFALRIVDESDLIDEAVDELERSGLLDESSLYHPSLHESYGTLPSHRRLSDSSQDRKAAERLESASKKSWLLNAETRRFLSDTTMWYLAGGFFLVTGPGEAFINNLGTILDTLYTPSTLPSSGNPTTAATHVSLVAVTSTIARILTGTLTDLLAPTSSPHQHRRGPSSLSNSLASLPPPQPSKRVEISRITFLLTFALLCSLGQVLLASGAIQNHAERFWLVSSLIGAGYGATFSLTPIIVSVVWGVENFGTNWGIVATVPAVGATVWGLAYSGVYQWAAGKEGVESRLEGGEAGAGDILCHGLLCYGSTFWAMAASVWVACGLWFWAWRGPGGWFRRGVLV